MGYMNTTASQDLKDIADALADITEHRACALAARETAIARAVEEGLTLTAIATALGITTATASAIRDRVMAPAPQPAGISPRLRPTWDETYEVTDDGDIVERAYEVDDLVDDLAQEYGLTPAAVVDILEADARWLGIDEVVDAEVVQTFRYRLWEAARDPRAGAAEMRALRTYRHHFFGLSTPPEDMIIAAAEAGAYRGQIAQAAGVPEEEITWIIDGDPDLGWDTPRPRPAEMDAASKHIRDILGGGYPLTMSQLRCLVPEHLRRAATEAVPELVADGVLIEEEGGDHPPLRLNPDRVE